MKVVSEFASRKEMRVRYGGYVGRSISVTGELKKLQAHNGMPMAIEMAIVRVRAERCIVGWDCR